MSSKESTYSTRRADAIRLAELALAILAEDNLNPTWSDVADAGRLRAALFDAIAPFTGAGDETPDATESWTVLIDKMCGGVIAARGR